MPDPQFYRELDATSATAVARSNARIGNTAKVVGLGGALLLAGWMFYGSRHKPPPSMTAPDKDEFHIVQFPSPSIAQPQPQTDQQRIVIEPEPAAPPPPPAAPPASSRPPVFFPVNGGEISGRKKKCRVETPFLEFSLFSQFKFWSV